MGQNFKLYSQYYDLLYKDKDYVAETDYLIGLLEKYHSKGNKIIELGSGTGKHANLLAEKGHQILGIEQSAEMVEIANQNKKEGVSFQIADITDFRSNISFDIAISLFHVISYLTNNGALIKTFKNVHHYLNKEGLFIFDVWHSAAVHSQIPEKRTKILRNQNIEVTRNAKPVIYSELNIVEVNYDITVKDLNNGSTHFFQEQHPMRHFSRPEIELLAYTTGFEVIHTEEFLSQATPSVETWGVCYILKKL
ncbi:class I SAM-dependent methyltransferase [Pedobacter sp. ISL-68]|uniref:class I SAM-dependent DNA methyltransferase n=1 Tax=unclassified Pedobacter TaxID=2628915 RepID=UPI001BE9A891|nr:MULTISPECIES: class I SAM-dependent methyltransferase [unclassified Pedobacter]MBT2562812.1 class I SAM-dependent methyltransferase [Pedobacter sp. ISL-64]MBT2593325.1 class I SAM-dependent methyltransferase [Pedobacter sp. ISL-68]